MMTPLIQVSVLVLVSLMASVGAQLAQIQAQPAQIQPTQVQPPMAPLQAEVQPPVQVAMPPVQTTPTNKTATTTAATTSVVTTKPVVTRLEVGKPVIRIETPVKVVTKMNGSSKAATTAPPKNRMKILKSVDFVKASRAPSSDESSKGFLSSLVDVDRAANKSRVGVHIPLIFDMTNDKDVSSGKSKLDLTVLSGMVTVNKDRENGKGPLTVTVFGIPVYTGTGNTLRDLAARFQSLGDQGRKIGGQLESVAGSRELSDATMDMYSSVKRTGEKGVGAVTDSLDRMSSFLKDQAAPIANTNGRPATKSDIFVTKPPQLRPQDMKPSVSESAFKRFAANNMTAHDLHLQTI